MRRTAAAAVAVGVLLACVLILACAWGVVHDGTTQRPGVEQQDGEDCDAEDLRNRETDCGFAPGTKPTTKTATRKPTPATKTRTTKR